MNGLALHRAAEHRHGVRVVQEDRVGAVALHVAADVQHHRDRAQGAEDAGDPRVSPMLMSTPYFFGISMSCRQTAVPPARIVTQHGVRALQRLLRSMVATTLAG